MATIKTSSERRKAPKKSAPKQKIKIIFRDRECDKEHGGGNASKLYCWGSPSTGCVFFPTENPKPGQKIFYGEANGAVWIREVYTVLEDGSLQFESSGSKIERNPSLDIDII